MATIRQSVVDECVCMTIGIRHLPHDCSPLDVLRILDLRRQIQQHAYEVVIQRMRGKPIRYTKPLRRMVRVYTDIAWSKL